MLVFSKYVGAVSVKLNPRTCLHNHVAGDYPSERPLRGEVVLGARLQAVAQHPCTNMAHKDDKMANVEALYVVLSD